MGNSDSDMTTSSINGCLKQFIRTQSNSIHRSKKVTVGKDSSKSKTKPEATNQEQ